VLPCSGNDREMRGQQLTAIRAIAASGARRIVKISGSPVSVSADSPARTGRDHFAIEEAMRATGRETVAIRPNTFMQNFPDQAPAVAHGALPGPEGDPRVSFVDTRDIGRVAAAALVADQTPEPVLEVTGPEALTWFDVAETMSAVLGRPITHYPMPPDVIRKALVGMGRPEWLVEHLLELGALMREPKAVEVTDTVQRMTGRPPTTLRVPHRSRRRLPGDRLNRRRSPPCQAHRSMLRSPTSRASRSRAASSSAPPCAPTTRS
jgi:uncharacterized protein YbjT (DUF2867 family)